MIVHKNKKNQIKIIIFLTTGLLFIVTSTALAINAFLYFPLTNHNQITQYVDDGFTHLYQLPTYPKHGGTDYVVEAGESIFAAVDGEVIEAEDGFGELCDARDNDGHGYGNHVKIRDTNGFITIYGHMQKGSVNVYKSDPPLKVKIGDILGKGGSSGWSRSENGPCKKFIHLHFEIRSPENKIVNPYNTEIACLWVGGCSNPYLAKQFKDENVAQARQSIGGQSESIPWWRKAVGRVADLWQKITQPVIHFAAQIVQPQLTNNIKPITNNQPTPTIWSAQIVSQSEKNLILKQGETATVSAMIKNTGNQAWLSEHEVAINTYNDISKTFYHSSWQRPKRPVISSSQIQPNQDLIFSFQIQAPSQSGVYTPSFQITYRDPSGSFEQLGSVFVTWQITVEEPVIPPPELGDNNQDNQGANNQETEDQNQNDQDDQENQDNDSQPPENNPNYGSPLGGGNTTSTPPTGGEGGGGGGMGGGLPEDTTPPETTLITDNLSPITNNTFITFQFSSNEVNSTFECQLDGSGWSVCLTLKQYQNLTEGNHLFKVRAIDSSGNADLLPAQFSWTIDLVGPTATITAQPDDLTNQKSATFEFSSEGAVSFECSLDDSQWQVCASPKNYNNLADGLHLFSLRAKDAVNNYSQPIDVVWLIDTVAPVIELNVKPNNPTNQTAAQFEFDADEAAVFACRLDQQEWQENCSSPQNYDNLTEGEHAFSLRAIDLAGNQSEIGYQWTIVLTGPISAIDASFDQAIFNADTWPGQITGLATANASSTVEVEIAKVEVQIRKGSGELGEWSEAALNETKTAWQFALPLESLTDDIYIIRSRATDTLGNQQDIISSVQFIFDQTPPTIPENLNVNRQKNSLEMNLNWDEADDNLSGVDFYEVNWQVEGQNNTTSTQAMIFTLTGQDKKKYHFKIWAIDKAGNRSADFAEAEHFVRLPSLVISEIQIAGQTADDEFIELFNSGEQNINLTGYKIKKKDKNGEEKSLATAEKFKDKIIKANGHLLLARENYYQGQMMPDIRWSKSNYLAADNTIIFYDNQDQIIDKVGWGAAKDFEKQATLNPEDDQSLERKSDPDYTYQDIDDNSADFFAQIAPNPQNSSGINNYWLNGWSERKVLVVDNKENSNNLDNFEIDVEINYQSEMKKDFSDVRFTDSDGKTLLNFGWDIKGDGTDDKENGQRAKAIVKIPLIAKRSEKIIYLYYGNPSAASAADLSTTLTWFDHFKTNRLSEYDIVSGNWECGGGMLNR